ncbi:MAG: hypothetical protein JKY37_07660 [Nannocystaceae bacterium]|nr:hypothetical protein [Nannocystaceae bacterium]
MKLAQATLIALIALPTLACDSGGAEYVKKMEEFAEKSCACKDAECTTKVTKEMGEWVTKNQEIVSKVKPDDTEKLTAATTKMTECMTKIATDAAGAAAK